MLFFFNDTATTEIYTLSLHDALPIYRNRSCDVWPVASPPTGWESDVHGFGAARCPSDHADRKSTRLNSSHGYISYAVFCLKKKKTTLKHHTHHTQRIDHCPHNHPSIQ